MHVEGHASSVPAVTTELEAKLIPGDGFRMPDLGELLDTEIATQPVRELDATYYDTADLDLARWGVTLRHRSGESGRPWTLKLPQRVSGTRIAREELTFAGGEDGVPFGALDLVRGLTRHQPLTNVARLHTTRTPTRVRDAGGQTLIEIVDDSVEVLGDRRELHHFREVEVEVETDSRRGRAAMKAAVNALLDAGCHAERPQPKLIRALGERAQQPPSVVIPRVGRKASTLEVIAHLTATSAVELLMHDPGLRLGHDPEAIHLYRVATRRLRADLRTFSRFLDVGPTNALRTELQWLGQSAGPVRDLDVLSARFAARSSSLAELDQPLVSVLGSHLAARREQAHTALLETIRSDRYDHALQALIDFAHQPPLAPDTAGQASQPAVRFARRLVKRRWARLAATVDNADQHPTDAELHMIRIAAKRCRYAAEAVVPVIGRPARRFAAGVEALQTVLGDHHDTVVAEAWLRDAAVELVDCRVAIGALISAERRERAILRRTWLPTWHHASSKKARSWL